MRNWHPNWWTPLAAAVLLTSCAARGLKADLDGDGLSQVHDACPDEPEDLDGVQDEDGCPEQLAGRVQIDARDPDGGPVAWITVVVDRVPVADPGSFELPAGETMLTITAEGFREVQVPVVVREAEDVHFEVQLEPMKVFVPPSKIEINERVPFALGSSDIDNEYVPMLHEIAAVLLEYPEVRRLAVVGHAASTDGGTSETRQTLSKKRATVVADHLIAQGVEAERLVVEGHGDGVPIDVGQSERNARVEFRVREQTDLDGGGGFGP